MNKTLLIKPGDTIICKKQLYKNLKFLFIDDNTKRIHSYKRIVSKIMNYNLLRTFRLYKTLNYLFIRKTHYKGSKNKVYFFYLTPKGLNFLLQYNPELKNYIIDIYPGIKTSQK